MTDMVISWNLAWDCILGGKYPPFVGLLMFFRLDCHVTDFSVLPAVFIVIQYVFDLFPVFFILFFL